MNCLIGELAGNFAVWAASPEARFLHGRFVWANWDVEELRDGPVGKQIREDAQFLKVGVEGLMEKTGGWLENLLWKTEDKPATT